jgi:hypothetical protein
MRIGFANIYAWRPHVEHMQFLALAARSAGHEVRFLVCDSDFPSCYSRELRPHNADWWECFKCRCGSNRSYVSEGVSSIGELAPAPGSSAARFEDITRSSANTLWRFESPAEFDSELARTTAQRLSPAAERAHRAALRWMHDERLDGIYVFNGRMDTTRAVTEAARDAGVPFVSVERSWFGDGLMLLPQENCIGLSTVGQMVERYRDHPLNTAQARRIARHVASRFLRVNTTEWRAYNQNAVHESWPRSGSGPRVLILPSSRNEFFGHPDWETGWREPTHALDTVLSQEPLKNANCVLRCHPNWGERIGHATGAMPERYYTEWARARDIPVIASTERTSTLTLIDQCDVVIVNGSSAALEAGVLGKMVIATGPSIYQRAGFAESAISPQQLAGIRWQPDDDTRTANIRRTLRFGYTMVARLPQFVEEVRSLTPADYRYSTPRDPQRVARLLETRELVADDARTDGSLASEDEVMKAIAQQQWQELLDAEVPSSEPLQPMEVVRRPLFRMVDSLRKLRPTGDR